MSQRMPEPCDKIERFM